MLSSSILLQIVVFVFGASIGSFLNVCIARLPEGISIVLPPSSCPRCGSKIRFYDNIPCVSYFVLSGSCRDCGAPIPVRYFLIELLSGISALLIFLQHGLSMATLFYFALFAMLLVGSVIDLDHRILPDEITIGGMLVGVVWAAAGRPEGVFPDVTLVDSIAGAVLGGGSLFLVAKGYSVITGREGLGFGDVKLMAMLGAWLGPAMVLPVLLWSSLAGSIIGISAVVFTGKDRRYALPFGPFLALGALLSLFFDPVLILGYILGR